jgi:hypothetical protein
VSCIEQVIISVCEMNHASPFVDTGQDDFAEADVTIVNVDNVHSDNVRLRN